MRSRVAPALLLLLLPAAAARAGHDEAPDWLENGDRALRDCHRQSSPALGDVAPEAAGHDL